MNATNPTPIRRTERPVALVLQGGGALGAFQVGAYQALCHEGLTPSWVAGTSIGAINAAIIAGNPPEEAVARLDAFWQQISTPDPFAPPASLTALRQIYQFWSAEQAVVTGQPGFFSPRPAPPFAAVPGTPAAVSFYDTSPLKGTLERLIDFDRINAREVRLSLIAVNVESGQPVAFDNYHEKLGPEHVMASGALPPAFPPVEVDGKLYWDGGIVSNTPLEAILDTPPEHELLIVMVDLWDPRGSVPKTMTEVQGRLKNITYASRSRRDVALFRQINMLRAFVHRLYEKLPAEADKEGLFLQVGALGCPHVIDILHLTYEEANFELASKDYEFSRSSVARHRAEGYAQARRLLVARGWCAPAGQPAEVRIHEASPLPEAPPEPSPAMIKRRDRAS